MDATISTIFATIDCISGVISAIFAIISIGACITVYKVKNSIINSSIIHHNIINIDKVEMNDQKFATSQKKEIADQLKQQLSSNNPTEKTTSNNIYVKKDVDGEYTLVIE